MFNSSDLPAQQKNPLRNLFTFDGRSLAAMRITTALILILDTLTRWPYLETFYSDAGILSRDDCQNVLGRIHGDYGEFLWSILFWSGDLWWAQVVSAGLLLFSGILLIGYQTRVATAACWVLLISFQHRNPLITTSGDTVLKLILFWTIFIPWGKFWSIDRRFQLAKNDTEPVDPLTEFEVFSAGTVGLLCQLVAIHFFEGLSKANNAWWSGEAIEAIIQFDTYSRSWTTALLEMTFIVKTLSFLTSLSQLVIALALLCPWGKTWWRSIALLTLSTYHLLWIAGTDLGLHNWIYLCALLFLTPGEIWELPLFSWIRPAWRSQSEGNMATVVGEEVFRDYQGGRQILSFSFCLLLITIIFGWHFSNFSQNMSPSNDGPTANGAPSSQGVTKLATKPSDADSGASSKEDWKRSLQILSPKPIQWLMYTTANHQQFRFLGNPPSHCQWVTYKAVLENGNSIDLRHLQPAIEKRPEHLTGYESSLYWRQLQQKLSNPAFSFLRKKVATYLTDRWNQSNRKDKQVKHFVMINHRHPIGLVDKQEHLVWYDSNSLSQRPASDSFLELLRNRNRSGATIGL